MPPERTAIRKLPEKKILLPTLAGIGSLMLWSSTVAFTRQLSESMGPFHAAFFINLFSGIACFGITLMGKTDKTAASTSHSLQLPVYLWKTGSFFVLYMVFFNLAIGLAESRLEVIVVGIINYLWPGFIFLFSVPLLGATASYRVLLAGILLSFAGTALAVTQGQNLSLSVLWDLKTGRLLPYLLSLLAAISWGMYSNLTRKYQTPKDRFALPLLFTLSACAILLIQIFRGEWPVFRLSGKQYFAFTYLVLFPSALAYLLWDLAMKKGNKKLITALSYLVPLLSTLISSLYLKTGLGLYFWLSCLLVVAGALLCANAIRQQT